MPGLLSNCKFQSKLAIVNNNTDGTTQMSQEYTPRIYNKSKYKRCFQGIYFFIFMLISTLLLLQHCSSLHSYSITFHNPPKIAVLPFTARGAGMSQRIGHIAADKLTTLLFMHQQAQIVDRSIVNYELHRIGVENVYFLSREQLTSLADTLHASLIVLGLIENQSKSQNIPGGKNVIAITLRFLNGKTGEVKYLVYQRMESNLSPLEILDLVLQKAMKKIPKLSNANSAKS
ncbi:MAG: hypothetical protein D6830_07915 [Ignavibacteria bacterium]|nr:MAG: hypothetical protein D6830_07915 [Ignavibacteria bacterium]